MLKKFLLSICILFIGVFALSACAISNNEAPANDNGQPGEIFETQQARKIIYTVTADIHTKDLDEKLDDIKLNIAIDEWIDEEIINSDYAYIVIRVNSSRLDDFLESISDEGTITNYRRTSTDVSITYLNKTNQINSYNAERERLVELMENATMTEILQINSRISAIDVQLASLNEETNELDSLVDYSKITLEIYEDKLDWQLPFGSTLVNTFVNSVYALFNVFKTLLIVIVAVLPFAIIIVPTLLGIRYYSKKKRSKKKLITKEK